MQARPEITVTTDSHLSPQPRRKAKSQSPSPTGSGTKKRLLRRENWEIHRATIKRLYIDEGRKLSDIVEIMRQDHGFTANARMYKHRLSQWGLIKYNREADVQKILQLKNEREAEGKDSRIEINGRVVDFDRVQRYLQRRKISVGEFVEENFERSRRDSKGSSSSSRHAAEDEEKDGEDTDTDSATITISTPTPTPKSSPQQLPPLPLPPPPNPPASFRVAEEVIWDARACAAEVVRNPTIAVLPPSPLGFALMNSVTMITELMGQQNPVTAGEYMQLASKQAEDMVRSQPHEAIVCLCEATLVLARAAPEVAALILRHAAEVSKIFLGEAHPIKHLLCKLAETAGEATAGAAKDVHMLVETTRRAFHTYIATWERVLGPGPGCSMSWWCWILYLRSAAPDDDVVDPWVHRCEDMLRAGMEQQDQEGMWTEGGLTPGPETGIPLERLALLGRYEIATALAPATVYRRAERCFGVLIQRCRVLRATHTQAFLEFSMAGVARQAGRLAEAGEYGGAAVASYLAGGNMDYAMKITAWMGRWGDQDFDSEAYKDQLMDKIFRGGQGLAAPPSI